MSGAANSALQALIDVSANPALIAPQILAYWHVLQVALIVAAIVILISASEDLFVDISYWLRTLGLPIRLLRRPRSRTLRRKPEQHAAVIVPAWHESEVIAHMLERAVTTLEYKAYDIFVGVYPNDPETRGEVAKACKRFANVHMIVLDHDGPTTKGDCLNQVVRHVLKFESEYGLRFGFFVNHDAEDVIHPFELKLMNWHIEHCGMVQLPVLSLNRDWQDLVGGHYMDEFAEWHAKDLVMRCAATGMTPSAGVGTALSRAAVDAILGARSGDLFDSKSLTEDYEIAFFLYDLGFRTRFVRYRARMPCEGFIPWRHELVATREFFPDTVKRSVRQKARWIIGIAIDAWRKLGWRGNFLHRYFLWRDRKVLFSAPAVIMGYVLVIQLMSVWIASQVIRGFPVLPPLVEKQWVWTIIYINLFLMLNRMLQRAIFVWLAHGPSHALISPLRIVVSNWITFLAFMRALRLRTVSAVTGEKVRWDKTAHTYPEPSRLRLLLSFLSKRPRRP